MQAAANQKAVILAPRAAERSTLRFMRHWGLRLAGVHEAGQADCYVAGAQRSELS